MEGVSGVVDIAQVVPGSPEYAAARDCFMIELIALVEGLFEGGATDVSIYDEHWDGRNVDHSRLPGGVSVFCGKPPYRAEWAGGLDSSHFGMILHGLHSKAGSGHVLCHTYEPDFESIVLNGRPVGEIGLETAIAGEWGVPLVLITADSAGVDEARQLLPKVGAVVTKISQSEAGAECFSLRDNTEAMRKAADAAAGSQKQPLLKFPPPITLELIFRDGPYLDTLRSLRLEDFRGSNTMALEGESLTALWAEYWQAKLSVQQRLSAKCRP